MPTGRPSKFTKKLTTEICQKICEGFTLRQIAALEGMPEKTTILRWLNEAEEDEAKRVFYDQYARAMRIRADLWGEEIIEIADDGSNDWMQRELDNGQSIDVVNHEYINRSKLRVDSRKWLMAKAAPKKYGEKVQQEVTGADGAAIVPVIIYTPKTG